MSDTQMLLHIGYHKTATTWMQQRFFLPKYGFRQLASHAEISQLIVAPHGLYFDPGAMRTLIDARRADLQPDEVPMLSSEILSGNPLFGGLGSDVNAHRLAQIFPQAKILISIRAQPRILTSVYMQYVLRGGTMSPERFFEGTEVPGYTGFRAEHFEYDRLTALYQSLFGAENVYLLTQESLKTDMHGAARSFAAFAKATRFTALDPADCAVYAPSYPEYATGMLRRINHVQISTLNQRPIVALGETPKGLYRLVGGFARRAPFAPRLARRKPVSDLVAKRFANRFADSNERLADIAAHPVDLSDYPRPKTYNAPPK